MITQQLLDYINQQIKFGKTREQITIELAKNGWREEDIEHAFSSLNSGVPVAPQASIAGPLPSIGSLFSESFQLLKQRFMVMFLSYLIPGSALVVAILIAGAITFGAFQANTTAGVIIGIIFGIAAFVSYFYLIFLTTASQFVALRDASEKTGTIENLKRSRLVMWSMFVVGLIQGLISLGGIVLLVIPGIILMVYYGFGTVVMVAEGKKGRAALAQSKAYVKGRAWKVFGRGLLIFLLYFVPYIILQIIGTVNKDTPAVLITVLVLSFLIQIFFTFYTLCFQYTLYTHLKNTSGPTNHEQYLGGVTGWTIWGSVGGVIIIIGLLTSVTLLSLNSARAKSRDSKRIADVRMISSALELYFDDYNYYPIKLSELAPQYITTMPEAPTPNDGKCTSQENTYTYSSFTEDSYVLNFCLGGQTSGYKAGINSLTKERIKEGYVKQEYPDTATEPVNTGKVCPDVANAFLATDNLCYCDSGYKISSDFTSCIKQ